MDKYKKILLTTSKILIILILVILVGFFLLSKFLCGTDVIQKYYSLSNKYFIRHSITNCGATTDFSTDLELGFWRRSIFSIKGAHENDLSAQWVDDKKVIINYTGNPELIYSYKKEISGIDFIYKNKNKDLVINCLYDECERISRGKEIERRKEWCNYSLYNRTYCDQEPGYETCNDGSWCHYDGPNR